MSRSGQWFIAATLGPEYTLYAALRKMGLPLTSEQERCQDYLEKTYGRKGVKKKE